MTQCHPSILIPGTPSSSSSSRGFGVAATIQGVLLNEVVSIRLPDEANGEFSGFRVKVNNGFHISRLVGWVVTMARVPTPRTEAFVVPATIPASAPSSYGVMALITLPEAEGPVQYWVPVLETHLGAVLHSREWTVTFNKTPRPATK